MDLNLKAAFQLCQDFGRMLIAQNKSGRIVNIASLLSFQGGIRVASHGFQTRYAGRHAYRLEDLRTGLFDRLPVVVGIGAGGFGWLGEIRGFRGVA